MTSRRSAAAATGLILRVPEAEPLVGDLRRRHDPDAAEGVPPHVTALYPFRPMRRLNAATLASLREVFRATPPLDLCFAATGRFPGVCWLKPEPDAALGRLLAALAAAFPDCPPYGGRFVDPQPHLTVARGEDETMLDRVEAELRTRLARPLRARIAACALFARAPDGWRQRRLFTLAGP